MHFSACPVKSSNGQEMVLISQKLLILGTKVAELTSQHTINLLFSSLRFSEFSVNRLSSDLRATFSAVKVSTVRPSSSVSA